MRIIAYRNVVVSRSARVKSQDKQLKVIIDSDQKHSIPIEDINTLIIESSRVQISSHALQKLALNGSAVYVCNDQHMPCGVLLPLNVHSRQLKILQNQLSAKKPLNKRLWQQIIQQKIIPNNGSIRALTITEKQYESMFVLTGKLLQEEAPVSFQQLTIF
ncbi:MAG: CRISPR-associated endonuclease Cas1 [Bacillota bacterium]|nr:CRISPR-associated endonuclease Cas1 [Bacillota bacterium]